MDVVSTVPQIDGTKLEQIMNNTMQVGVVYYTVLVGGCGLMYSYGWWVWSNIQL